MAPMLWYVLAGTLFVLLVLTVACAARALGRFLAARRAGLEVEGLIIGAGSSRRQWRTKTIPLVELRTFPFFVRLVLAGMSPGAAREPGSFAGASSKARFLVVLAGLAAIYVLSCGVALVAHQVGGVSHPTTEVTVTRGGEAESAGMRDGDRIVEVQGTPVSRWEDFRRSLETSGGHALDVSVERSGERVPLRLTPGRNSSGSWTVGSRPVMVREPAPLPDSLLAAVTTPWRVALEEKSPVSVEVVPSVRKASFASWLSTNLTMVASQLAGWFVLLSLPLPGLDGARLVGIAFEGLTGRRLSPTTWSRVGSVRLFFASAALLWLVTTTVAVVRAVSP